MNQTIRTMLVTPELALEFLKHNTNNRKMSNVKLKQYMQAMLANKWRLNGDTIKIAKSKRLLDGQHRLLAIVETNIPQPMNVVYDLDEDVIQTIDCGANRRANHILDFNGESNTIGLAASLNALKRLTSKNWSVRDGYTNDEIMQALEQHPTIRDCYAKARKWQTFGALQGTWQAALYYLFQKKDPLQADQFFERLSSGVDLKATDPVWVLRKKLIENKTSDARLQSIQLAALVIIAWNAVRAGKIISRLNWKKESEQFPEII